MVIDDRQGKAGFHMVAPANLDFRDSLVGRGWRAEAAGVKGAFRAIMMTMDPVVWLVAHFSPGEAVVAGGFRVG